MKISKTVLALALTASLAAPAAARDSLQNSAASSVGASLLTAIAVGWIAYQGAELSVRAVKSVAQGVELSLEGPSASVRTSAMITREAAQSAGVGVGTSVRVVAESTGTALVASGVLLAFVPNEVGRALLHHARHEGRLQ